MFGRLFLQPDSPENGENRVAGRDTILIFGEHLLAWATFHEKLKVAEGIIDVPQT